MINKANIGLNPIYRPPIIYGTILKSKTISSFNPYDKITQSNKEKTK